MAKKSKGKKQRSNTTQPSNNLGLRSAKSVKRARRRMRKKGIQGSPRGLSIPDSAKSFIRAALDPYADVRLCEIGVPDEYGNATLKYVNTMSVVVKPNTSGRIRFTILPSVSGPIAAQEGLYSFDTYNTDTTANGIVGVTDADPFTDFTTSGTNPTHPKPVIPWPNFLTNLSSNDSLKYWSSAYTLRTQRIVGQGCEIRFLGTELNNNGAIYAARIPGEVQQGRILNGNKAGIMGYGEYIQNADVTSIMKNDSGSISNVPDYRVQTLKSAEGCGGYLTLNNDHGDWGMVPYNFSTYLSDDAYDFSTSAQSATAIMGLWGRDTTLVGAQGVLLPIQQWQNLQPTAVAIEGVDVTSASFEVRMIQYVEAVIDIGSPFQQFTTKSPAANQAALDIVATVSKGLPPMVPVTMNSFGEWWKKIMGTISKVSGVIAPFLGPMAPIAHGVGVISDVLGGFASI